MGYRVSDLERQIEAQQRILKSDDTVRRRAAEVQLEKLERILENAHRDEKLQQERKRRLSAEENAKTEARKSEADARLTEQLRSTFFAGSPSATEADFERLLPTLRDQHLVAESGKALAEARRRMGSLL